MTKTCAQCGDTFNSDPADEAAAQAEAVALWGRRGDAPGMVVVCDACFAEILQAAGISSDPNKPQT